MVALAPTLYKPLAVPAGEVTRRVVEPLVPGESVSIELPKTPLHPLGTEAAMLKLALPQAELSLSVTVTVKLTVVPAVTDWLCVGVIPTEGFADVQVALLLLKLTCKVAPELFTAVGVMVMPAVESVKLCPTTSAGCRKEVELVGLISSRSLLLALLGAAW